MKFYPHSLTLTAAEKKYNAPEKKTYKPYNPQGVVVTDETNDVPYPYLENQESEYWHSPLGKDVWWFYDYCHINTETTEEAEAWLDDIEQSGLFEKQKYIWSYHVEEDLFHDDEDGACSEG